MVLARSLPYIKGKYKNRLLSGGTKMKRLLAALGILALVGVIAIPVLAHGPGYGRGGHMMGYGGGGAGYGPQYGGGSGNLTEEQATQLDKLHQKFYDDTAQLRTDIWAKSGEINTLLNTSNPDTGKLKALQKELIDLKGKMAQKRLDFDLETRKSNPDARGYGMGYGPHMRGGGPGMGYGPGMGMGYGRHMGGYGPGGQGCGY
jgi:zinc resistance-associated protein